ncbi:energy transducer TonB [Salinimicrobium flavum]|uniref:Energy transducer TonB n=1 Tax=Salinimicrobium flavum TaxID=1737065 RepID=A0ABW5J038_9FLAO
MNRIYVVFKINPKGDVVEIMARGPYKRLEEEAIRVVSLLPKMIPGRQRDKPVAVKYSLPIMYEVREHIYNFNYPFSPPENFPGIYSCDTSKKTGNL